MRENGADNPIRIVLVDDHEVLRAGLRMLLESQPDMVVVGESSSGADAESICREWVPDVVLMDITMPGKDGIQVTRELMQALPGIKVIALTMHEEPEYLKQVMAAGGVGYVVKRAAATEVVSAVRAALRGDVPVHSSMTRALVDEVLGDATRPRAGNPGEPPSRPPLSDRETEVLSLSALGHSNLEIAASLCISVKTVETHKARIMAKLGIRQRSELVKYAIEQGLMKTGARPNGETAGPPQ
jgi:two-component system response regulator NreC